MSSDFPWLTALIVLPLVGAAVLWLLPAGARRHTRTVALALTLAEVALGVGALLSFDTGTAGEHQLLETHQWIPSLGVSYAVGVDGVGLALILMSVVLVPLVVLAAWREQGSEGDPSDRLRHFLALALVLEAFIVAVFAARDVFFFYVLFEAMLIPVYFMIGAFGGAQRRYAAIKFLIYSLTGGLIMLVAVIALYLQGPGGPDGFLTDNLTNLAIDPTLEKWLFAGFFLAFAIKAPMFPVHTWLPDAAQNATPGTSVLLVGVLDKVGTFGMLTLCLPLFPAASRWAAPFVIVLAIVSIIYGALLAIGQKDLMRLIAYTSVSHFGFIVLGIFAFTSTSVAGSSFYMVNHGLSTGALFLIAGFLVARRGSQDIADFGGLQKVVPVMAGTFLVAGLSALSLPGLSTFVSEFLVLVGTFARHPAAAIVATLGVVLAAIYVLWTYQRIFTGPVRDGLESMPDMRTRERWAVGPLLVAMLVLGFVPGPALDLVRPPASVTLEQVGVTDLPASAAEGEQPVTFTAPHVDWAHLSPVLIVLGAAAVSVLLEAFVPARHRRTVQLAFSGAALAGALIAVAALWSGVKSSGGVRVLGTSLIVDGPTLVLQGTIAALALVSLLIIADRTSTGEDAFAPSAASVPGSDYEELARRQGLTQTEVYPLVLFATGGMLIFPATGDLLTLFVALEVLSLPLYLLTGMARRRRLLSQEAAMKYFLLGAFASALMLFGIGLVYGYAGSLSYADIAAATQNPSGLDTLLLVGSVMVLAGLLFKIGAVPFHAWTPDVYQGAPTPITGFMAACTKVAAFGALLRVVYTVIPGLQWDIDVVLWTVTILTMVVGTVIAMVQTDMKRLLAYSSVAHAGFILTGVVALDSAGVSAVLFYLLVYGAATIGAFGVVWLVRERDADGVVLGEATHLSQWAGIGRRHPWHAGAFALFLFSFAGIPLTAGFVGKFGVFSAAVDGGAWPLALLGVLASAGAAFFYVRIVVLMFFSDAPADEAPAAAPAPVESDVVLEGGATPAVATLVAEKAPALTTTVVGTEGFAAIAIALCAVTTIVLGVFPTPVLDAISHMSTFLP